MGTEAEEQQESLRTQVDYYETFIRQNPTWEYVKVYVDLGRSGTGAEHRPKSQKMITDAKAGKPDVFDRYANGASIGHIIRELSEKGAKRVRSDKPFTASSIFAVLANELYAGDRLLQKAAPHNYLTKRPDITGPYNSYYITDDHQAIVDREVWELAKSRREQVKDSRLDGIFRNENTHFLYGIVFCGDCGVPYKRRTVRSRNGQSYKAWECGDRLLGVKGNGCKNQIITEESLLQKISERLELTWNGVEAFDVDTFHRMVADVEVTENGVKIKRVKSA